MGAVLDRVWLIFAEQGLSVEDMIAKSTRDPKPTRQEIVDGIRRALRQARTTH